MLEEFVRPPTSEDMRAQLYESEHKRISGRIEEIDARLNELFRQESTGEVADNAINPEVALLNATKEELETKLQQLQTQFEHGR